MHNKPGMKPLDGKTKSGKIIDLIIKELPFKCAKTNLCEVDYMPIDYFEIEYHNVLWGIKYEPSQNDIIVLLGNWVHKNFWSAQKLNIIKLAHPASCFGHVNKEKYVLNAIKLIGSV